MSALVRGRGRARALPFVATLAALAAGCGYTEMHEVVLRAPTAPAAAPVEVYMIGQAPPRPFYEVALLQAIGHGNDATLEEVVKSLSVRARAFGCDAVVRVGVDQGYSMAHGFGVCVRWAGVAPAPAPMPGPVPAPVPPVSPAPAPAPAPPREL